MLIGQGGLGGIPFHTPHDRAAERQNRRARGPTGAPEREGKGFVERAGARRKTLKS